MTNVLNLLISRLNIWSENVFGVNEDEEEEEEEGERTMTSLNNLSLTPGLNCLVSADVV